MRILVGAAVALALAAILWTSVAPVVAQLVTALQGIA